MARTLNNLFAGRCALAFCVPVALAGCAATLNREREQSLSAAGFVDRPASTPER